MSLLTSIFSPLYQFWRKEFKNADNRTRNLKTIRDFATVGLFAYLVTMFQQPEPSRMTSMFQRYMPELKFRWISSVWEAVLPVFEAERVMVEQGAMMADAASAAGIAGSGIGGALPGASLPGAMATLPGAMTMQ